MSNFAHVCILAKDPSKPVVVASTEVGKEMFRGSAYGPDVTFRKEIGLGYWSVFKGKDLIGWINMSRVIDEEFLKNSG